jgi:hypothetical protein
VDPPGAARRRRRRGHGAADPQLDLPWQAFAAAGAELATGLDTALLRSIARQARHVRENLAPARNHRTLELYALLIAALALPDLDPGGALLGEAALELDRNLETDFRRDGVHIEASTHYHLVALRSFVGARENARRYGVSLPEAFEDRLQSACEFAVHCRRPDGQIPALSDADQGDYSELLELAGVDPTPPRTRADFPDHGWPNHAPGGSPMIRTTRLAFALALAAVALTLPQAASARPAAERPLAFAAEDGNGDCPDVPVEESAGCEDLGAGDVQGGGDEESLDVCDSELEPDCDADGDDSEAVEPTLPATVKVARRPVNMTRGMVMLTATCQQTRAASPPPTRSSSRQASGSRARPRARR